MQNFFGIDINTENMSLEELVEAEKKARDLYSTLAYQVRVRKYLQHKYSSNKDNKTAQ